MDEMQESLFTTMKLEDFVPVDHPLRPLRLLVNRELKRLYELFGAIYADSGRVSIAVERLLRAPLSQVFYSVRSELLMVQVRYNSLFRRGVALSIDDAVLNYSVSLKNCNGLLVHKVIEAFFAEVVGFPGKQWLLSREQFSVDGSLVQAWAGYKSIPPKDGSIDLPAGGGRNADTDGRGKRRSSTHESSTDPDARLFRKDRQSGVTLCCQVYILMEARSSLVVGAVASHADGFAERAIALRLLDCVDYVPGRHSKTPDIDKGYDVRDCRACKVTLHVARNDAHQGGSAIGDRTSLHASYYTSRLIRKLIDEHFGWGKTVGRIRQTVYRGVKRVDQHFKLRMLASNLTRIARMLTVVPQGAMQ
ncbi:IS5 family transposase [Burkholderia sp. BCC0405]|uniref:IS5 family transposase n=1 Tax=Burkholderia sp. BCC0405 TaxID=2676298 RepID=UPI00158DDB31|nr:IS5 family transposase [Burkholderia sp. BCC0405]